MKANIMKSRKIMNQRNNYILLIFCFIVVLLLGFIFFTLHKQYEIDKLNELKVEVLRGDCASYNQMYGIMDAEDILPYSIIMADVYNYPIAYNNIYKDLESIYESNNLKMSDLSRNISVLCLDYNVKNNKGSQIPIEMSYFYLSRLFENVNQELCQYYAIKALTPFFTNRVKSFLGDKINVQGVVNEVTIKNNLYKIIYEYSYKDLVYRGMSLTNEKMIVGDSIRLFISTYNPSLSIDEHTYLLFKDIEQ